MVQYVHSFDIKQIYLHVVLLYNNIRFFLYKLFIMNVECLVWVVMLPKYI